VIKDFYNFIFTRIYKFSECVYGENDSAKFRFAIMLICIFEWLGFNILLFEKETVNHDYNQSFSFLIGF